MPRRQDVTRISTDEIQGEGSWVELRPLRVKRIREIVKQREGLSSYDSFELGIGILKEILAGWNWADEEGNPLPQPAEDPSQLDEITSEESEFLIELFQQQSEAAKKSRRRSRPRSG